MVSCCFHKKALPFLVNTRKPSGANFWKRPLSTVNWMQERIIDTHIHVWNFKQAKYSWLEGNATILNRDYDLDMLEEHRDSAGITDGILVQAANNFDDTDWMLQVAGSNEWIRG